MCILTGFPAEILPWIEGRTYTEDRIGMSGARVLLFDKMVLKIEPASDVAAETIATMRWLESRLPTPQVLASAVQEEWSYLLMSRVSGEMSCAPALLEDPSAVVAMLAEGLRMLWRVDPTGCPRSRPLSAYLTEAADRVARGLVDVDDAEPETFQEFSDPTALLHWLETHRPPEIAPRLCHGDYCLPNVFVQDGQISGFIDLGDAGLGDPWRDIALCYRSLKHNFDGSYGGKVYPDFDPASLFDALGIKPDWERIRYHLLLDELF